MNRSRASPGARPSIPALPVKRDRKAALHRKRPAPTTCGPRRPAPGRTKGKPHRFQPDATGERNPQPEGRRHAPAQGRKLFRPEPDDYQQGKLQFHQRKSPLNPSTRIIAPSRNQVGYPLNSRLESVQANRATSQHHPSTRPHRSNSFSLSLRQKSVLRKLLIK